jgi:hypothetical protein
VTMPLGEIDWGGSIETYACSNDDVWDRWVTYMLMMRRRNGRRR